MSHSVELRSAWHQTSEAAAESIEENVRLDHRACRLCLLSIVCGSTDGIDQNIWALSIRSWFYGFYCFSTAVSVGGALPGMQ